MQLGGCAVLPHAEAPPVESRIAPFSSAQPGNGLPTPWRVLTLSRFKRATTYTLTAGPDGTVIEAVADNSASGLMHPCSINLEVTPWLTWRWRVDQLISSADNSRPHLEDSPVRVIVAFAGDKASLDPSEQLVFDQVKMFTGQEMPYATLMYIWENQQAVGTVIDSTHTSRVKMIVAASGSAGLGEWRTFTRNIREDYQRAFGTPPPRVKYVGVMTDSDNTGSHARGYYGDLAFSAAGEDRRR